MLFQDLDNQDFHALRHEPHFEFKKDDFISKNLIDQAEIFSSRMLCFHFTENGFSEFSTEFPI